MLTDEFGRTGDTTLTVNITDAVPEAANLSHAVEAQLAFNANIMIILSDWYTFLNTNDVLSYAISMGTGLGSGALANLQSIANDGVAGEPDSELAVIVTDFANLFDVLLESIPEIQGIQGNPTDNGGTFGADGGFVLSVTVDGITDDPRGNDVLDLSDLLQGADGADLNHYLGFSKEGEDTVISISTSGAGSGAVDQVITLKGVDLMDAYGIQNDDAQLIQALINGGKLKVDNGNGN